MGFLRSRSTARARVVAAALLVGAAGAAGCQSILGIDDTSFDPQAASDAGTTDTSTINDSSPDLDTGSTPDAATGAVLTFTPARVYVNQGSSADIAVTLVRNGFTGSAIITLGAVGDAGVTTDGGANGVSASPLTIASGSTTGILHVSATSAASLGLTTLAFAVTTDKPSTLSVPALIGGAPGTRDLTFGISGVSPVVNGYIPVSVAVGDDDSLWVVNASWSVLHYFADGTSDDTLNTKLATTLSGSSGQSTRLAVRGSVIIVGGNDGSDAVIRKLATSGSYDPTFGSAGVYSLKEGSNPAGGSVTAVAFSSAGDVLASATVTGPTSNLGGVIFRLRGNTQETYPIGVPFAPVGIGVDPSGHIATAGAHTTPDGGINFFAMAIDDGFHDAGLSSGGDPSLHYTSRKAVVSSASQIGIASLRNGIGFTGSTASFSTVDGSFLFLNESGHNGTWDMGFYSIAAQADGKLLVTGEAGGGSSQTSYIHRINVDGGSDPTWSYSVGSPGGNPHIVFHDLAADSFGRVVGAGDNESGLYLTRVWP